LLLGERARNPEQRRTVPQLKRSVQVGRGGVEITGGPVGFCGCDQAAEDRQVERVLRSRMR
jgi:hypothetical protein